MHLHHPSLSLAGKRKGKVKFRNAAEAQRARESEESWKKILKQQGIDEETKKKKRGLAAAPLSRHYSLAIPEGRSTAHIKSLGQDNGVAILKPSPTYTGDKCIGITVLHKSCLQPIFSKQEAVDAARMRR